ncbi:DUF4870 domain-containing protein [Leptolyngbya sp. FACHB-711]|uniref:DUF4870 domain-containing protein n=1 Tax=unclassified Leptolyngbya TaxID=2650499 RepID=UPI00168770D1|nr:DUF4870 domain-containing protein [Leptolyngbya sp. FACHB-711]MBD1848866.1 DUF4870 domain-containing protein [Cyanobacteria bacterium FACHB-502]MBD2025317.1 DUF4870 domain-containing protein [Leptolyngbya sp. FACHB-711]
MRDLDQQKALSIVCHASVFLSSAIVSIVIPIVILATNENPIVKANARESINFHISLYIYAIAAFIVGFFGLSLFIPFVMDDSLITLNLPSVLYSFLFEISLMIMVGAVLLFVLLWLASLILPLAAIVRVAKRPEVPYRYPLIFRLL